MLVIVYIGTKVFGFGKRPYSVLNQLLSSRLLDFSIVNLLWYLIYLLSFHQKWPQSSVYNFLISIQCIFGFY